MTECEICHSMFICERLRERDIHALVAVRITTNYQVKYIYRPQPAGLQNVFTQSLYKPRLIVRKLRYSYCLVGEDNKSVFLLS